MILLLSVSVHLQAQQVNLRDAESREPLPWAAVEGIPSGRYVLSNERGRADLSALLGDDSMRIRIIGYESALAPMPNDAGAVLTILMKPGNFALDQVLVSATRWEQEGESSAAKVISIGQREIALQNPQTAADMLASTGQVYVQKSQLGGGSPMIRGFSTNRLLLVVDGVRMNSAIFRSGNLQNVVALDPLAIERSEVLFGPGSVLYGSDAIGGVMSFNTLQPHFSSAGQGLKVSGSVFGRTATTNWEKTAHADLHLGHERWASVTSFTFTDYDDQVMGSHGPDEFLRPQYVDRINGVDTLITNDKPKRQVQTGYSQFNIMQKLGFKVNEDVMLDYGFHYSRSSDVPRYDRLRRPQGEGLRSAEWYYGPQVWAMHNLRLSGNRATGLYDRIRVNLAIQQFQESRNDRNFNSSTLRQTEERVDAFSANIDLQKSLGEKHMLLYGLEGVENFIGSNGSNININTEAVSDAPSRYPDGSRWSSYAVYAHYQTDISEQLRLEGGARYNLIAINADIDTSFFPLPFSSVDQQFGALTGSLGMVWKPDASWVIRAHGGSAFRAPNIDDVGKVFDSEPGRVVVPTDQLRPEYAWNAELGIARVFGSRVRVDVSVFRTWLQDALVRRNFSLNGLDSIEYAGEMSQIQAIQNAARANVYGFLAAVELKLPAGFEALARWNYQNGEEELDDGSVAPLRHAAPWFSTAELRWSGNKLRLALIGHYHSGVRFEDMPPYELSEPYLYALDENGNPYTPSWYRLDFRALYQISDMLRLSAGIENITDQRYQTFSSGIAAAGFSAIVGLRLGF